MSQHLTISPSEAADRLAIRELVEAYAHCADRRDAKGQMSLYRRHSLRGVHERQGSEAFAGAALARGARSSLRRSGQVRGHHARRSREITLGVGKHERESIDRRTVMSCSDTRS